MSLREYRRKRDFQRTAEPAGDEPARTTGRRFVVQKHAASRLHYDFRLEWDGVLKSWAVPKGPSLDPEVKALAVEVEDHPLAYATFEGIIPQGEYGGGTVMVWDQGEWDAEDDFAKGLKSGHLKFTLHGEKLSGSWALVRMKDRGEEGGRHNWLLMKHSDDAARRGSEHAVTRDHPASVLTGRTISEIAEDADSVWSSNGKPQQAAGAKTSKSRKWASRGSPAAASDAGDVSGAKPAKLPDEFAPQLATLASEIPTGDDWLHELKFDGYRLLAFLDGPSVRLVTRRGHDWTHRFADIAQALKQLGLTQSLLDGELVALDAEGVSDFQRLQNWMKGGPREQLVYYVFDAPYFSRFDLRKAPLIERKNLLARLLLSRAAANDGIVRYSDHIRGQGPEVLQHSCRHALEGVVSKRADSPYESRRTRSWLKSKCQGRQEFVIGGFTRPQKSRKHFGALLVGYGHDGDWIYCGRVGTGFTQQSLKDLGDRLKKLKRVTPAFSNPPVGAQARGVTWVEPQLVAEVEFSEWTDDGLLRHPSFQGLREDKAAGDVVQEVVMKTSKSSRAKKGRSAAGGSETAVRHDARNGKSRAKASRNSAQTDSPAGVTLSHPDRVLFPEKGFTKRQLAGYYEEIADWILPELVDRPLTIVRCPQGRGKQCFYQKHWTDSLPAAVDRVLVTEKDGKEPYVVIRDLAGLISLVQVSVLELHPWGARADRLDRPDRLVFDLDPGEGVGWSDVRRAAIEVRDVLLEAGLKSFVRTSGGKGLHVVVPITRRNTWEEAGDFARDIAVGLSRRAPDRYVAKMTKSLRPGRIFVDYLRNREGATSVASYSTRARPHAPVATPLAWEELDDVQAADQWRMNNVPGRLQQMKADPWAQFAALRQSVTREAREFAVAMSKSAGERGT